MTLQDYTTEELRAELKRRSDLAKAEKAKVKRCRMCKHWGAVTYTGKPVTPNHILGANRCCIYFPSKTGTYYKCHRPYHLACEHFEEKEVKL